jgi:hypothetical protein
MSFNFANRRVQNKIAPKTYFEAYSSHLCPGLTNVLRRFVIIFRLERPKIEHASILDKDRIHKSAIAMSEIRTQLL